jgi:hypothetical protein
LAVIQRVFRCQRADTQLFVCGQASACNDEAETEQDAGGKLFHEFFVQLSL